ncbi:MAG: DNA polymerase thumb domain-containing protein [Oscillospiraceae bacterium]
MPVGDLLSVGRALAEKLTAARIRTIGDLARTDLAYLQKLTGVRTAALLHDYACGVDPLPRPRRARGRQMLRQLHHPRAGRHHHPAGQSGPARPV